MFLAEHTRTPSDTQPFGEVDDYGVPRAPRANRSRPGLGDTTTRLGRINRRLYIPAPETTTDDQPQRRETIIQFLNEFEADTRHTLGWTPHLTKQHWAAYIEYILETQNDGNAQV